MRNQFLDKQKKIVVGDPMTDAIWDSFLPQKFQILSPYQWTPISVIERTWKFLSEDEVKSVVDLGSGVGKFCIYLSLVSGKSFPIFGLEDREELVLVSKSIADHWGTENVQWKTTNFLKQFPFGHSHYYCFNPLYETMKGHHSIDDSKEKSAGQFVKDLQTFKQNLVLLPSKTKLITFHGFGGSYLPGFRTILKEEIAGGEFRVWEKE
ncbi:methyltransferase [Leptospira congkakensis]|uniref:Methyltransferase n=1 Tax=Leptospira congkakensis TaxID=2484932 RepID=A0A4Z1A6R9_9LEPT|nr:methyltransferase [Leptospira congkakensis]TGL90353.1 methyltransferase [Leptospira congkakensis]TGL91360.1 methyltransferase [Leptospira congkakensis]TGL98412.1 methyltransferase [Leptospira congkakensis]